MMRVCHIASATSSCRMIKLVFFFRSSILFTIFFLLVSEIDLFIWHLMSLQFSLSLFVAAVCFSVSFIFWFRGVASSFGIFNLSMRLMIDRICLICCDTHFGAIHYHVCDSYKVNEKSYGIFFICHDFSWFLLLFECALKIQWLKAHLTRAIMHLSCTLFYFGVLYM